MRPNSPLTRVRPGKAAKQPHSTRVTIGSSSMTEQTNDEMEQETAENEAEKTVEHPLIRRSQMIRGGTGSRSASPARSGNREI